MANELFEAQGQYGDVSAMAELSREAPISGAPLPGQATTSRPAAPGGAPAASPGVMAQPYTPAPGGVDYYTHQRKMWSKLAAQPGAGQALKDLAAAATAMHRAREQGRA